MIRAIVTDIEGTTSDIRFVHNVLFPYARQNLPSFITGNPQQPAVALVLDQLRAEIDRPQATVQELIGVLFGFMDEDRKSTALKALQGMVWRDGYLNGCFTGHLYPDVLPALQRWQQQGLGLYVYSSGSVAAQKLLFGYSDAGDITGLFSGYFDTHVGAKREVGAYQNIASQIGLPARQLMFLSDIHQELDAARDAGWHTVQLIRGDADNESRHRQVTDFDQINQELLNP
ncbi:acireductone synthase [Erwinia amylovora]|uniref:Enolase-phosphatase E1 n=3 Tax=Erwinia amylovora TaxID=552 RepID=A0A831A3M1_ERWAM|nr:acireductone synthase [Erwinia amylovora]CDK14445.1 enolase-phosphatase [Erwinia amylovora LA635]CDK17812.1 enolase-phosphatase [Erwinia amylovora LA636]CDK21181.1 enolase-phosphatase [Erwinia amylovora LA637]ATZ10784.1 acireductone synthase [Erwinia amylovora]EKV53583.1 enolase-phosphatase [Erwinia amylovora ACW56400]